MIGITIINVDCVYARRNFLIDSAPKFPEMVQGCHSHPNHQSLFVKLECCVGKVTIIYIMPLLILNFRIMLELVFYVCWPCNALRAYVEELVCLILDGKRIFKFVNN